MNKVNISHLTLTQKNEIVFKYNNGASVSKLSDAYNIKNRSLARFLKNQNEANWRGKRKYDINESFFDIIDTEAKAYWLGFICADGSIMYTKVAKGFEIQIQHGDIELLTILQKHLETNKPIKTVMKKNGKLYSSLRILNLHIADTLMAHNIKPRKTYNLEFPSCVPDYLLSHFVRGLSDGDGCIYIGKSKRTRYKWSLLGTLLLNKILKEKFETILNIGSFKINTHPKSTCVCELFTESHVDVEIFLDWCYSNATIYLGRKYDKYKALKQHKLIHNHDLQRKLTAAEVVEIRGRINSKNETMREIALDYNVSHGPISAIKRGKVYKNIV